MQEQYAQWVHVVGIVEFVAPYGEKFKHPCFGYIGAKSAWFKYVTPSSYPYGIPLTYKVKKRYEDDSGMAVPRDTHHILTFTAELGYSDGREDTIDSAVNSVEAWVHKTLSKINPIMGCMQIHVNGFDSRTTRAYALDRDTGMMHTQHVAVKQKKDPNQS